MLGLMFSENLESDLGWLEPMTAVFEHCTLREGVIVEEPCRPCGVMK
jgi:hypothetical protein